MVLYAAGDATDKEKMSPPGLLEPRLLREIWSFAPGKDEADEALCLRNLIGSSSLAGSRNGSNSGPTTGLMVARPEARRGISK
jgi:hypothetical protein